MEPSALMGGFAGELIKMGLPGVVIMGLAMAIRRLAQLYHDAMERRIEDAKEHGKLYLAAIQATESQTRAFDQLRQLIEIHLLRRSE
jgi:hypothetical protein